MLRLFMGMTFRRAARNEMGMQQANACAAYRQVRIHAFPPKEALQTAQGRAADEIYSRRAAIKIDAGQFFQINPICFRYKEV
jgi:hypothetical protein